MKLTVIGPGLIGGSMAMALKERGFVTEVTGVDRSSEHLDLALERGIIDQATSLEEGVNRADLVIVAVPVDATCELLPRILDQSHAGQVILDVGSTKSRICEVVDGHSKRERFVATHPIAGTENTGPQAAFPGLFENKIMILSEIGKTAPYALEQVREMCGRLQMKVHEMEDPREHDRHIAYVSHLSHVSSYLLGKTVLDKEKDEQNIFLMAGSGFGSTVRLAKSSPDMWAPIFEDNVDNVSEALGAYIDRLQEFKRMLDEGRTEDTRSVMEQANAIRRILEGIEFKEDPQTPEKNARSWELNYNPSR